MQHEIDIQFPGFFVVATRRVIAHRRARRVLVAGRVEVFQRCLLFCRLREEQFDVVVGAQADEACQLRPLQGNAAHQGRQFRDPHHLQLASLDFMHDAMD
ncbi:hypothetical protein ALO75_200308 [Pseudomonas syringae pv. coryli]|uniref:Pseudouridine synthase n=1 Tax=Pseudomonas syringae pv. coryli TaxID=317659 RepID=A0A0N8R9U4_9PSED|nr:hypothetical protein ALO75_200308 [Pseudomonas syringae pv. coryli]